MHILTFRSTPILPAVVSRSDTHTGGQNMDTAAMYVQEACKFMEARANATANSVSDQRTRHTTRLHHTIAPATPPVLRNLLPGAVKLRLLLYMRMYMSMSM